MRILITGASGFVGLRACEIASQRGFVVQSVARVARTAEMIAIGGIGPQTDWGSALSGVDVVLHLAARVHVMSETAADPLTEFRKVNTAGTLRLAQQAAEVGVKRFVLASSIKVNGEETVDQPFNERDTPQPQDTYAVSKAEAEQALWSVCTESGMEGVVIRPPLVYGPGVKANFLSMMRWLNRGIPLPLGSIKNTRSLVALDNLVDLIITCIDHPAAANQTFLVSDGEDLSTTELLRRMGAALGKPARLLPVPPALLSAGATVLGKRAVAQRLLGSLQVDISKTQELLGWTPPVRVDDALRKTAEHFLADQG